LWEIIPLWVHGTVTKGYPLPPLNNITRLGGAAIKLFFRKATLT
jgi:hypothetical protein